MESKHLKGMFAGAVCAAMACTSSAVYAVSVPSNISTANKNAEGKVVCEFDFEDGNFEGFSNRGGDDTTELSISTEMAVSGSSSLCASGRSASWNGPAFRLDGVCEPNTEYLVSASVAGKYYTGATLSFQYNDADGETHYSNLVQNLNGGGFQSVKDVKVSFTDDMSNVFVYFEGGTDDLYIDDFKIVEVPEQEIEDIPALKDVYADYFKFGTAITPSDLSSKSQMALVNKHFSGSITVGNEMKPDSVLNYNATKAYFEETGDDETPQISFSAAKPVLNYCLKNNIPVRIHTLVWHSQTPLWFFKENYDEKADYVSKEKMLKRMENYIKSYFETLTELYPDIDFYACDVVNEAWSGGGGKPRQPGHPDSSNGYGASDWVAVFGDNSFIEPAFTFAREYAPKGCKLYYNDYNEYMTENMNAITEMAKSLKEKGVIDGIGMQSHLDVRQSLDASFPSVNMYKAALDNYASLGLDIQVTELDATIPENSGDKYFDIQAEYFNGIMDAIESHKDDISAVVYWGITDPASWRASQQPLLFDGEYKAKPAYYAIIEGIEYTAPTTTEPTPTECTTGGTSEIVYGDANCDGTVTMADAVAILQNLANSDKYPITDEGRKNADVDGEAGVTAMDALTIQQYDSGAVKELPIK